MILFAAEELSPKSDKQVHPRQEVSMSTRTSPLGRLGSRKNIPQHSEDKHIQTKKIHEDEEIRQLRL